MKVIKTFIIGTIISLIPTILISAQENQNIDSLAYDQYKQDVDNDLEFTTLFLKTASYFLDAPYVSGGLEKDGEEKLVCSLREFDCTTFIETSLALAFDAQSKNSSWSNFKRKLTQIRYRNGHINGYISRLHYMSDWIENGEKLGMIKDITSQIGGSKKTKTINFMSEHSDKYRQLINNRINILAIKDTEVSISSNHVRYVIAKDNLPSSSKKIRNGDIILFATNISGLDYSHVGIAFWDKGILKFIHASSQYKKIVNSKKSLYEYCKSSKICEGVTILRIKN